MKKGQFNIGFKSTIFALLLFCSVGFLSAQLNNIQIRPGAWQTGEYIPLISKGNVALVANQTSTIGSVHLLDTLLKSGVKITRVFGPEHGFRGNAANGEHVSSEKDPLTGIPVISLYGKHREPTDADLEGISTIVFDLQDVGVRFYTHLTTLHHIMNSCAEKNIQLVVLDRPNPNGYYTDGPILQPEYRSDVGIHPIPLVHGMTLGELAQMINGEKWLRNSLTCKLTVVKTQHWNHNRRYTLPVPPSPNLPTPESIIAYPTLGLFEGIDISIGRGTEHPFECFGAPWLNSAPYTFYPVEIPGKTMNPPYEDDTCHGYLIKDFAGNYLIDLRKLYLEWLVLLLEQYPDTDKNTFFNPFFDKLAGTDQLKKQLLSGIDADAIRETWKPGLEEFKTRRKPYLLYSFDEDIGLTW